eukprot:scaffold252690_cov23-Tisochrysis_lutea.AAC.1
MPKASPPPRPASASRTPASSASSALGVPLDAPTLVGTDNLANMRVGSLRSAPTRARHFMRRYHALLQRVAAGE